MRYDETSVCMAYIHPHNVDSLFYSLVQLTFDTHPSMERLDLGCGPRVAEGRNQLARAFLAHPRQPEWFWMVDADMACAPDLIDRMLEHADPYERPILGALCFMVGRTGILEPTLKRLDPVNGGFETLWDYPENQLIKIDATGGACMLIHRKVFEELDTIYGKRAYPFFADTLIEAKDGGEVQIGEDVTFCIRARQRGYPIWAHTGLEAGHIKPYVYTSEDYHRNRLEVARLGRDEFEARQLSKIGLGAPAARPAPPNRAQRRQLARAR